MSKAKIVENLGRGKYLVKLIIDIAPIKERIKALDERITKSTALINGKLQSDINTAKTELNAIDVTDNDSDTQHKLAAARKKYDDAVARLAREKADRHSAVDELGKLKAVKEETDKELWCADYNLDLEKGLTVGIIDLYQLREKTTSNRQIIVPGYIDAVPECAYNPVRDGRLVPAFTLSPNSWWYAMMICAGLERFNPRYRKGRITFIYNLTGSELTEAIAKATEQVTASKKEVTRIDDLLHEKYADMNDLTDALKTLQTELADLEANHASQSLITAKKQQISDKQTAIIALENEINVIKYDLQVAQEQLDSDQSHLNALNAGHNLCNVTVDDNYTQIQPHEVHVLRKKEIYLRNVPVRYMSCDELAFKVGDRVVLEYPRKNIHQRLITIYHSKHNELVKVKATAQAKIDALEVKITAKNAEIAVLNAKAEELTVTIKTEHDAGGITDLQAEIDALEDEITALNEAINTYQDDKDAAQSDVNNLTKQISDKQDQLISLQQQLDDLIANGGSSTDILAKQNEINTCLIDIARLQNDLQQATQALSEANFNLDVSMAAKKDKMQQRSEKQNIITPLLNVNTLSKQELKFTLEETVLQTDKLRSLEDAKMVIEVNISGIDAQLLKLEELEIQEQVRSDKLKAFADTRPKEITIVGFESNPRPCGTRFVTYADWHTAVKNSDFDNSPPPHSWGSSNQFIHKRNLKPEERSSLNSGGFYETNYNPVYHYKVAQHYWFNDNDADVISWDIDTIYIAGKYQKIVDYTDARPHNTAHWSIATCAIGSKITQANYNDWEAAGSANDETIIGKKQVIVILYDKNIGYKIAVYALISNVVLQLCYERQLPDYDWSIASDFVITGFRTDAETVVYWTRISPSSGGIYKLLFKNSYTYETRLKLGGTAWPVYSETNTYNWTGQEGEYTTTINAATNTTTNESGNTIVDVFFDRDNFTVIYKRHTGNYSHSYTYLGYPNPIETITVSDADTETHDFYSAYISWESDRVVDDSTLIFAEYATLNRDVAKIDNLYSGNLQSTNTTQTKLLYAHHKKRLFVYRTAKYVRSVEYNGTEETATTNMEFKLIVSYRGSEDILEHFNDTITTTTSIQGDPTSSGNYSNSSSTYPVEWYYYDDRRHAAYDGKLLVCCYDLKDSDITTAEDYRERPRTLIYKNKDQYLIKDYRVDYDNYYRRTFPITVTSDVS